MVAADGPAPDRLRAGQPDAGNPARRGARGGPGRDHRHRARRTIPTRSTTSCAFPSSSAARWTSAPPTINDAMETGLRRGDRRACPRLLQRRGGGGLPGRAADLRARLPDPQALRPAPARRRRERGGRGGDGDRRRDAGPIADIDAYRAEARTARSSARPSSCARCSRRRAPPAAASSSPRARTSGCCARPTRCSRR